MRRLMTALALTCVLLHPAVSYAQGSIAGLVKDSSGAVLPGVTVEASSPVLIEKTRTVVSDGTGRYNIVDLRPGRYTVTFTLPGFNTVKREGIELTGSFAATVDAEMRVGALEETITVSGETPIVDVQNTTRQAVMNKDAIDSLPTGRTHYNLAVLVPSITIVTSGANGARAQDVGGALPQLTFQMSAHGSKGESQRLLQNGVSMAGPNGSTRNAVMGGGVVQEMAIDIGGASAEADTGGVRINFIPKEGGNSFRGTLFGSFTNDSLEGDNLTQDLINRGLLTPTKMKEVWDFNPGVGGPIKKDKLWFYFTARRNRISNWSGSFRNVNENNPNAWTYVADKSQPFANTSDNKEGTLRLTWQISPKNKLGALFDVQRICSCPDRAGPSGIGTARAPDAAFDRDFNNQHQIELDWTSPITNRVLLEVASIYRTEGYSYNPAFGPDNTNPNNPRMIPVTDQDTGLTYRAFAPYSHNWSEVEQYRAALSYVTGTHNFKVGMNDGFGPTGPVTTYNLSSQTQYRFNKGVPNQITEYATPYTINGRIDHDFGLFVQDRWTIDRFTLSGGLRYHHFSDSYPEQHLGPALLAPTRDVTFPAQSNVSWNDIVPRSGMSWDLFGNGKTAVKVTLNKYLSGNGSSTVNRNPTSTVVNNTTRTWTDDGRNGGIANDFIPQCDLTNPLANGECDKMLNALFGKAQPGTTFDPDVVSGWGKRNYNWEFSAGVQREIVSRISAEVSYFRRWYGNLLTTDNTLVAASDYTSFNLTVPSDSRLPNSGGQTLTLIDLNTNKVGQSSNYVTFADNFGGLTDKWHGLDFNVSARLQHGVVLQGGVSTGKETVDNCDLVAQLPERRFSPTNFDNSDVGVQPAQYCHIEQNWLTQLKVLGSFTIPRVDVQISGTFQSVPGIQLSANWVVPNAQVAPVLGRSLSGGASSVTTNLVNPGTLYGERLNQLDFRFAKLLKAGRTRTSLNVDLYNATNAKTVLQENFAYTAWRTPTQIITPRFVKLGATFDF